MEEAVVTPLKPPVVIEVDEADAIAAQDAASAVLLLQRALGEERERYLAREREILDHLTTARIEYEQVVKGLTRRYVKEPGDFQFVPDLGAFVGTGKQGDK